jgi:formate-dependent nitrite reductase membrane component NrfD
VNRDPRDPAREARLDRLKAEAQALSADPPPRPRTPERAPRPEPGAESGYYGEPILKPPVWTWEVPLYLFLGGTAGAAAVIALAARLAGDLAQTRVALAIAVIGALLSPPLLISDLGRPRRFLNMLRVVKVRSPMSVGAWVLVGFTPAVAIALAGRSSAGGLLAILADPALALSALLGMGLATYTGVLLAVSAIPVWSIHRSLLPPHFAASALGSAAALLELLGFLGPATMRIGLAASAVEVVIGAVIELRRRRPDRVLRHGRTGWAIRCGGILAGPIPLLLRIAVPGARPIAAASFLLGALFTRYAWLWAGRASAADLGALFALQGDPAGPRADSPAAPATPASSPRDSR